EPHVPYQVSEPYFSRYTPASVPAPPTADVTLAERSSVWRHLYAGAVARGEDRTDVLLRARASYVGMVRLIDDELGRLVDHIRASGLNDRTLLVFLSDHGDFAGEYGLLRKGGELSEVLTRVPMLFNGAGVRHGLGRSSAHVSR